MAQEVLAMDIAALRKICGCMLESQRGCTSLLIKVAAMVSRSALPGSSHARSSLGIATSWNVSSHLGHEVNCLVLVWPEF
jgi:hypothetical protein